MDILYFSLKYMLQNVWEIKTLNCFQAQNHIDYPDQQCNSQFKAMWLGIFKQLYNYVSTNVFVWNNKKHYRLVLVKPTAILSSSYIVI